MAVVRGGEGILERWLRLRLSLLLTTIIGKREGSLKCRLWLLLYSVLPCIIYRSEVFREYWLSVLLLATDSLNKVHWHLLHKTGLRLYKISRERHHLRSRRSRKIVARLLHVRHE